jgi:hypothetical protein
VLRRPHSAAIAERSSPGPICYFLGRVVRSYLRRFRALPRCPGSCVTFSGKAGVWLVEKKEDPRQSASAMLANRVESVPFGRRRRGDHGGVGAQWDRGPRRTLKRGGEDPFV